MAKGLSSYRIGNVAKSVTEMNLSKDARELLKGIVEDEIRIMVHGLEEKVLARDAETKTLLDPDSEQLSLNRIKTIMAEETTLNASSEAAITLKSTAEDRIRYLAKAAEARAAAEGLRTIKARHIPVARSDGEPDGNPDGNSEGMGLSGTFAGGTLPFGMDSIRLMVREETGMKADHDACMEMREFVLDELDTSVMRMEEMLRGKDKDGLLARFDQIRSIAGMSKLRRVAADAAGLARERGKRIIGLEEVSDAFDRL